jgi:hypothetical protein
MVTPALALVIIGDQAVAPSRSVQLVFNGPLVERWLLRETSTRTAEPVAAAPR